MIRDLLWKLRCPETGNLAGDCGCFYCHNDLEIEFGIIEKYSLSTYEQETDEYE